MNIDIVEELRLSLDRYSDKARKRGSDEGFWTAVSALQTCLREKKRGVFGSEVTKEQKAMWNEVEAALIGGTHKLT